MTNTSFTVQELAEASGRNAALQDLIQTLHPPELRPLVPAAPPQTARCFVAFDPAGHPLAHAAVLHNPLLRLQGVPVGVIGFFEARNEPLAARAVLDAAAQAVHAANPNIRRVVGPLNGSTWAAYRVALPGPLRFLPDVHNPPWYARLFLDAGWQTLAEYLSTELAPTPESFARLERGLARLQAAGIRIDDFAPEQAERDLSAIFAVSSRAFVHNLLYTPADEADFLARYRPYLAKIDPAFILIARDAEERPVGFVFALRNPLAPPNAQNAAPELIVKTLAILPDAFCRGLGSVLVELLHRRAHEQGFATVYHALMHADNLSARIGREAKTCRRYQLFQREIS